MISTQSSPYQDMWISRDLVCALDFITCLLITDITMSNENSFEKRNMLPSGPHSQQQPSKSESNESKSCKQSQKSQPSEPPSQPPCREPTSQPQSIEPTRQPQSIEPTRQPQSRRVTSKSGKTSRREKLTHSEKTILSPLSRQPISSESQPSDFTGPVLITIIIVIIVILCYG